MSDAMITRLEEERDYRKVEELTREAFWNVYRPGCSEHFILHRYRERPDFVRELDYVVEDEGQIVAHIMYSRSEIICDDGRIVPTMTFGPISVLPQMQGKGYGSRLIRYTMEAAQRLGCGALVITGNPDYYRRFGFVSGHSAGVCYGDIPREEEAPFFMVAELKPGYLEGISGVWQDPEGYLADEAELEEFDKTFPLRKKEKRPGQLV